MHSIHLHYSSLYGSPLQALLQATYAMGNTLGRAIGGGLQEVGRYGDISREGNTLPCFV